MLDHVLLYFLLHYILQFIIIYYN